MKRSSKSISLFSSNDISALGCIFFSHTLCWRSHLESVPASNNLTRFLSCANFKKLSWRIILLFSFISSIYKSSVIFLEPIIGNALTTSLNPSFSVINNNSSILIFPSIWSFTLLSIFPSLTLVWPWNGLFFVCFIIFSTKGFDNCSFLIWVFPCSAKVNIVWNHGNL